MTGKPKRYFMLKEEYLDLLLKAIYTKETLNVYDYNAAEFTTTGEEFANTKAWADQLVREKLAVFTDPEHTTLQLTNFGKYWILKGGYEIYLKEGQILKKDHHNGDSNAADLFRKEKEDLLEARLRLTHYRLIGFWLMIIVTSIGFLLSLYNLFLIINRKK
jgi:hypothetical protein